MTHKIFEILWYTFACLLLLQGESEAYGPVTHIHLGCEVLGGLSLLAPGLRILLRAHSQEFLYGNVAADVIIAKNLAPESKHCHNWNVGFGVLQEAENDSQKAFAWGYLCHLAADVIAHNYYVPWKLVVGFPARTTGHAYWEIRLDQKIPAVAWELVQNISRQPLEEHHGLLSRTIQGTLFKFETNLTIFNGMLFVQRLKRWRTLLNRVEKRSRWTLPETQTSELLELSTQAVIQLLSKAEQAPVCLADPTGIPNLQVAKQLRKMLRRTQMLNPLTEKELQVFLETIRNEFLEHVFIPFSPERWPEEFRHPKQVLEHLRQDQTSRHF